MGQRMPAWVDAACDDYARRLPRDFAIDLRELKPAPRGRPPAEILAQEATRIAAACGESLVVALDEHGAAWPSAEFAQRLGQWRDAGAAVAFVIGSADGLDPALKARAHARLALSAMTLPHALARVLLCEQVFRAWSLLHGHPYHRA
jgi:23S rRNA (pseudouridine1915-N3)-methyltransferase